MTSPATAELGHPNEPTTLDTFILDLAGLEPPRPELYETVAFEPTPGEQAHEVTLVSNEQVVILAPSLGHSSLAALERCEERIRTASSKFVRRLSESRLRTRGCDQDSYAQRDPGSIIRQNGERLILD